MSHTFKLTSPIGISKVVKGWYLLESQGSNQTEIERPFPTLQMQPKLTKGITVVMLLQMKFGFWSIDAASTLVDGKCLALYTLATKDSRFVRKHQAFLPRRARLNP